MLTVLAGSSSKRAVRSSSLICSIIEATSESVKCASSSSRVTPSMNSKTSTAWSFCSSRNRNALSDGVFPASISATSAGSSAPSNSLRLLNCLSS
ncbi:MAG: hypothetical protein BWY99_02776 [Synergistetes bacterium ADurb.BinA166]|nr:MAG: hypothetical protein BWY99_02776 [Synergistetes bacterium ADurb.BinA166]